MNWNEFVIRVGLLVGCGMGQSWDLGCACKGLKFVSGWLKLGAWMLALIWGLEFGFEVIWCVRLGEKGLVRVVPWRLGIFD